ncbi:MAG: ion transporter [Bacteroidales bacterium]|nr:ion transporter [Candidatus Sodaliphilus fimicaballi]
MSRKRIYDLIERHEYTSVNSRIYDAFMAIAVIISIVPLMFMQSYAIFKVIEICTTSIFIFDYILRWLTADYHIKRDNAFWMYPFTPMAIIDLLSILPIFAFINPSFRILRSIRLFYLIRIVKLGWYSNALATFSRIIYREKNILLSVLIIALTYVFTTAIILFNVEPHINPITGEQTFTSFFDALYWATVTLTTVGYGDITPVTVLGRLISMFSSLFGVAIIALPSGVITASYIEELRELKRKDDSKTEDESK